MFSQISNISLILNNGKNNISRIYSTENSDQIKLLNKYFIYKLTAINHTKDGISSGNISLNKDISIVYTTLKSLIVVSYIAKSDVDYEYLNFVETNELLLLSLEKKFPNIFLEHSETQKIGKEIDEILGMKSLISYEFPITQQLPSIVNYDFEKLKEWLKNLDFNNKELFIFQGLSNNVNAFVQDSHISEAEKNNFQSLTKEISKFCELEMWLTG